MARVEVKSQANGVVLDSNGNAVVNASIAIKNLDGTAATHYSAKTGGTSSTANVVTSADGTIPRFVETGSYNIQVTPPGGSVTTFPLEAVNADQVVGASAASWQGVQEEGANLTTRGRINFIGAGVTAADDSANGRTNVTIPGGGGGGTGHTIQDEGSALATRTGLNFTGAGVTATDDVGNNRTNVTIPGTTGHTIQDEGSNRTARTNLNFVGAGVTVTDSSGTNATVVTIPGGGTTEYIVAADQDTNGDWWRFDIGTDGALTTTNVGSSPPAGDPPYMSIATDNSALGTNWFKARTYLGNGNEADFDSEPNIPITLRTYHGNAGGLPITGRPQQIQGIAKYFAPTTTDTAQSASFGSFLVDSGTPFTQTLPVLGLEGDGVVQGDNTVTNKVIGVAGSAEAQDTAAITDAICFYAAEKSASEAGAVITNWTGLYVENPLAVGTVTDNWGVYSRPRLQTETALIIGVARASTTAAMKGMTLLVAGTNASGQPAVRITKKSGSTDDILQIADSGGQTQLIVNQGGQLVVKTAGQTHTAGSSVGANVILGNITTPPSANFSTGGFLYSESGALKWRGSSGTVTTLASA